MIPGIVAQAQLADGLPPGETDPLWEYVVFLCHGEGADESSVFTDRSSYARTITAVGAVQVDTDIVVGDSPSIKFDSDANYLHGAYGPELDIAVDGPDFCMEAYVYCTDLSPLNQIFGRRRNSGQYIMQISNGLLQLGTFNGTGGTTRLSVATGMSNNTSYHVAIVRVGTTYYGFVDGVLKGSNNSPSGAISANTTDLFVGQSESDQPARYWRGNLNWMRITMGHQRYDVGGFTPPSLPYPTA